jgi:hypothetical protein
VLQSVNLMAILLFGRLTVAVMILRYWFLVDRWIGPEDKIAFKAQMTDPELTMIPAVITLNTMDTWDAATDCDITISVHGTTCSSGTKCLGQQQMAHQGDGQPKLPCQRGSSDTYELRIQDVGEVQHISVGLSQSTAKASWGLASMTIQLKGAMD